MGMKIEGDQLVLPPVSERPDGFDLYYQRRSLRRTYQYEIDEEQFSLTVCKDQPINVDTDETDGRSFNESAAMVNVLIKRKKCFVFKVCAHCISVLCIRSFNHLLDPKSVSQSANQSVCPACPTVRPSLIS